MTTLRERNEWNRKIRDSVDSLLQLAGYADDSSARHNLAMMNFDALAAPQNPMSVVWLVGGKTFSMYYASEELADKVCASAPPTLGFEKVRINVIGVAPQAQEQAIADAYAKSETK